MQAFSDAAAAVITAEGPSNTRQSSRLGCFVRQEKDFLGESSTDADVASWFDENENIIPAKNHKIFGHGLPLIMNEAYISYYVLWMMMKLQIDLELSVCLFCYTTL